MYFSPIGCFHRAKYCTLIATMRLSFQNMYRINRNPCTRGKGITRQHTAVILLFFSILNLHCDNELLLPAEREASKNEPVPYPYITGRFSLYYTSLDSSSIPAIADSVAQHSSLILQHLAVDSIDTVKIYFHSTYAELDAAVQDVVPDLPPWAIGLATAKNAIHMFSPKHPEYNYEYMIVVLIHEYVHCVTLNIKSNFGNNPRWLWESIAIYEAGQFIDPRNIPYMVARTSPSMNQLNSFSNTYIYDVGYLLAEFIVTNWSYAHLRGLILNNGNTTATLGMTSLQFHAAWFEFVKTKYGI